MDVSGAVAVVTGGTGSIGPKIMAGLAVMGAVPVAWDLFVDGTAERGIVCDVADPNSVEAAMDQTVQRWGLPTVLVTAAAISSGFSPLARSAGDGDWPQVLTGPSDWERVLRVNVIGVANCMRVFARQLARAGRPGAIVNISSMASGPVAEPGLTAYSASKAAVNQLTRVAAAEFGPLGIRVNAVGPGMMAEPMLGPTRPTATSSKPTDLRPADFALDQAKYVPIEQRHGRGEDIAQAVCAVLQMDWVTGQIVFADGGLTLRSPVTT